MGFDQQLQDILSLLKKQAKQSIQTLLLSATLSPQIQQLAALSLHSPTFLDVDKLQSCPVSQPVDISTNSTDSAGNADSP